RINATMPDMRNKCFIMIDLLPNLLQQRRALKTTPPRYFRWSHTPPIRPHSCYAAAILIGLGFISSFLGKTVLRTPSLYSALTPSPLTGVGNANDRLKEPYSRSMR